MVCASSSRRCRGLIGSDLYAACRSTCAEQRSPRCWLRRSPAGGPSNHDQIAVMRRDKKAAGGLTFVLPGANGLETVEDPDPRALDVAFAAVGVSVRS